VTANRIPIRNMVLQYNYVFDRIGGLAQLNNVNWPQYVSTITVSGISPLDKTVQVLKYRLVRRDADTVTLQALRLGKVASAAGSLLYVLGGD
jgi:hypothetical protein